MSHLQVMLLAAGDSPCLRSDIYKDTFQILVLLMPNEQGLELPCGLAQVPDNLTWLAIVEPIRNPKILGGKKRLGAVSDKVVTWTFHKKEKVD